MSAISNDGAINEVIQYYATIFPNKNYFDSKGMVVPSMLYCSALYLQLERLQKTSIQNCII